MKTFDELRLLKQLPGKNSIYCWKIKNNMVLNQHKTFRLQIFSKLIFLISVLFVSFNVFAQQVAPDSVPEKNDSTLETIDQYVQQFASKAEENRKDFINNLQIHRQHLVFDEINKEIQKANKTLKQGFDYEQYAKELATVIDLKDKAIKGILLNSETNQLSIRNLTTSHKLLNEILNRTNHHLGTINEYNTVLSNHQFAIDSLSTLAVVYQFPEDSVEKAIFLKKFSSLNAGFVSIKLRLKNALDTIHNLQVTSTQFKNELESDLAEVTGLQQTRKNNILSGNEDTFKSKGVEEESYGKNLLGSMAKGLLLLLFYFTNHYGILLLMMAFLFACYFYLRILKKKYIKQKIFEKMDFYVDIFSHPFAVSVIVAFTIFQFLLPDPPFMLIGLLWINLGWALVVIHRHESPKFNFYSLVVFFIINVLAIYDNLILEHSIAETWFILILAVGAAALGIFTLYHHNKYPFRPRIWLVMVMVVFEIVAVVLLLTNNYNAAKALVVQGIFSVIVGYLLMSTYLSVKKIIVYTNYLKETDDEGDIQLLNIYPQKITFGNLILFIVAWFVLVSRNSFYFQEMMSPLKAFVIEPREIGKFVFSYQQVLLFIGILFLSALLSRVITFLTSQSETENSGGKSTGVGSWLLLIKIAIITVGIIIAFISVGIKMDKIAIIVSSLGVGIGFGLQTVINNLVSGLIIAFEKPINLNDIVEINGQIGKMKSIGIRASVVTTWDGADVIIPNGDLLNQHLINWTMGNTKRRYELLIGVAYGTDLMLAKGLLEEVLEKTSLVLKYPQPMIWVTAFNDSSIDIVIKYWVGHFSYGNDVKSDLIIQIDQIFRENNIVIPFPQRDIHIQTEIQSPKAEEKQE